jgi:hypothetical protein
MTYRCHTATAAYHLVWNVSRYHGDRRVVAGAEGRRGPAFESEEQVLKVAPQGLMP